MSRGQTFVSLRAERLPDVIYSADSEGVVPPGSETIRPVNPCSRSFL